MKRNIRYGLTAAIVGITGVAIAQKITIDRTKAPELGPPPPLSLPPVETRTLSNGMKLLVVEQHELPLADFALVIGSGAVTESSEQAGVAALTAQMLTEGTTTRNSLAIADQMAFLGVQMGASLSQQDPWDATLVYLHTPTAQLDSALALYADVVLRPSFPQEEFERIQKLKLTELLQRRDYAPAVANEAFAALVFGNANPYGRTTSGNEKSVGALKPSDLRTFYQTYFRPNNATLVVVGDVKPNDIERRIEALFGKWEKGDITPVTVTAPPKAGVTTIYIVDKPGAPQSSFRIGSVGVSRETKDYFALEVMNTLLGGSFTSRLNLNLREKHGYTYGAFSSFDMRKAAGPFVASAEVVATKTDSALVEFMKELRAIRDTVPADELSKAKRYLQLQLPASFETTTGVAGQLVPVSVFGLPLDYYNTYIQNIDAVTAADVQRVAQEYINPENLAIVIVGDRKLIEPALRRLNIGAISIRDMTGREMK
jgi:zinc protease